ncbi:Isocitrate dehydrogenase [NAD] catalytic subunit 5 [Arachis hypogaea]|nr:Isocitrate dehydrogenase [NAD] catalytic subunit 5 [Arachis hypogaea]
MATAIGKGHHSLYANFRPCYSLPSCKNTGEYSGPEYQVVRGVVESLKIITRQANLRVAEYAFHYTKEHGRERVSAIHKANIMQKTEGLFLKGSREVAEKMVSNLYGNIISDLCAGLVGGLGLTASCKIGEGGIALAEAVPGSAPDIAGKNSANPTTLLLSGVSILRHLNLHDKPDQIQNAILDTIAEGKYRTADLGGVGLPQQSA